MKLSKGADLSSVRLRARYTTKPSIKVHALENKVNSFINVNSIHTTLCMGGGGGYCEGRERERLFEMDVPTVPR